MIVRLFSLAVLLFCQQSKAQGLNPFTPAKEYIRLNGQVVAVENVTPTPHANQSPATAQAEAVSRPASFDLPFFMRLTARQRNTVLYRLPLPAQPVRRSVP